MDSQVIEEDIMALAGLFSRKTPEQMLRQNQRALNKVCMVMCLVYNYEKMDEPTDIVLFYSNYQLASLIALSSSSRLVFSCVIIGLNSNPMLFYRTLLYTKVEVSINAIATVPRCITHF